MAHTTGPSPPQLALPPHFSILDSFYEPLPHYDYDGKSEPSSLSTTTGSANPPHHAFGRPATITPAPGAQPVGNLWEDIGLSLLTQVKINLDANWITLQPIWKRIQEVYDNEYANAYVTAASGSQPPADFQLSFANPNMPISCQWGSFHPLQKNLVAERMGEKAGKAAVQNWVEQNQRLFLGPTPTQSALWNYGQFWINWATSYAAEQEHLYMKEKAMRHHNESDVVRTAAMYLLHPVMGALDAVPNMNGGFMLQSENVIKSIRTDITFYRYSNTGPNRAIAVLEFKRRGVLRPDQFDNAMGTAAPAPPNTTNTLFEHEALKVIKQASSYAVILRTRHVALCDWNYLILCYFPDMPYNGPTDVGTRVEIQRIPIGTPDFGNNLAFHNSDNSNRFRPALLGFLKHAYEVTPP